ncbi:lantibiotic immunity ABC transporter MutG family permease subunit [Enterococcus sp. 669A]|uniref:Lantibiotic immunity ABC transporter MutG family permease subunit n=1 Tax=Candidatus Enterococcus moelleringii TaxID=2815325 RepID=A0ABS3L6X7_9ENTE|nr:lantibiotic immunity ABC transporter MutG family permease subunit [Enterococcus sp. 669A]MBO1305376.1 lantibiotic immunity ABC transporter MutG family permease subunit [Enterococcus sp. 669A]
MLNQLKADTLKLRRTPFFLLHLLIPLLGIVIFISYQQITPYQAEALSINYDQLLALIYPLIAVWMCTIVTDQEFEAGGGFFLLYTPSRKRTLLSKLLFLTVFGLMACLLVVLGYHLLVSGLNTDYKLPIAISFQLALVIWCCSLFQYFFHTWIGLRFGRNVNFAVAAFELLLGALLLTGLGETIWFFFPCAWGVRLVPLVANQAWGQFGLQLGVIALLLFTVVMGVLLFAWFPRWEGRKNEE